MCALTVIQAAMWQTIPANIHVHVVGTCCKSGKEFQVCSSSTIAPLHAQVLGSVENFPFGEVCLRTWLCACFVQEGKQTGVLSLVPPSL